MPDFLTLPISRKILFEKYDVNISSEEWFVNKLDGCEIISPEGDLKSIFNTSIRDAYYLRNNVILFSISDKTLLIEYGIFKEFETVCGIEYNEALRYLNSNIMPKIIGFSDLKALDMFDGTFKRREKLIEEKRLELKLQNENTEDCA